ncbi:MAG: hypothetical protein M3Y45_05515, partial [Actinomycetota bacterium]|nr:hypothetical protein [Actinomycetota bacterium]
MATPHISQSVPVADGRENRSLWRAEGDCKRSRWQDEMVNQREYSAVVAADKRRVLVPVPFDPDTAWGRRREHLVAGTVNGMGIRAAVEPLG